MMGPRTISFEGCTTDAQALKRLDAMLDDLEDENVRAYAAQLFEHEPDIDDTEFEDCLAHFRAALKRWRAEHHAEQQEVFRRTLDARTTNDDAPVRGDDR